MTWFDIAEMVTGTGPFPGSPVWSQQALQATVEHAVPSWRVCGARAARHANCCGPEDPGITGSVAQEQAAKPLRPHFSSGRNPGF